MASNLNSLVSRASAYVAAMPPAISGNHGSDATFAVAVALMHGFALPRAQAWPVMLEFNARCEPPWSKKDLEHKLDGAAKVTRHSKPRGYLLGERGPVAVPEAAEPSVTVFDVDPDEPLPGSVKRAAPPAPPQPAAKAEPPPPPAATEPEELEEVLRIAGELAKLHKAGALGGPADPEAAFYAALLRAFSAEFVGKRGPKRPKSER
jgi:hypothetical protein